ncbi:YdcH family protein [Aurantiacibacter flavus]|uniref:DUF465 domain-containing protein n=1 Tax=Aurantiacibacter flavus TaxID=3145232 RepID=A0ABV0CYG2_9SPHN
MSHTPHELAAEFPDDGELLHQLKLTDAHFVRLADEYHNVNRAVHRIESEVEAASDERAEALKKQRLGLLDELSTIVTKAREAA